MVLHPREGDVVVYCHGGDLRIFQRSDWENEKSGARPLAALSRSDSAALAWFLRYWLGEAALKPGYQMRSEITAEFDY